MNEENKNWAEKITEIVEKIWEQEEFITELIVKGDRQETMKVFTLHYDLTNARSELCDLYKRKCELLEEKLAERHEMEKIEVICNQINYFILANKKEEMLKRMIYIEGFTELVKKTKKFYENLDMENAHIIEKKAQKEIVDFLDMTLKEYKIRKENENVNN